MAINKFKRRATSLVCAQVFLSQMGVTHTLSRIVAGGPHNDALGDGLTEKEKQFVRDITLRMHKDAELLRKLSHRLRKEI